MATGGMERVVEGCYDEEEVAERCSDFVKEYSLGGMFIALCKGIQAAAA